MRTAGPDVIFEWTERQRASALDSPPVRPPGFLSLMRLDPAGLPFIGGALLLAVVSGAAIAWVLAIPFIALGAFFAFFFRDPERTRPDDADIVLSPAVVLSSEPLQ